MAYGHQRNTRGWITAYRHQRNEQFQTIRSFRNV